MPTSGLCRAHGMSPETLEKLRAKFGAMDLSNARRPKQFGDENAKLWHLQVDAMIDQAITARLAQAQGQESCGRIIWTSPDDADATAGRSAAGDEGHPVSHRRAAERMRPL